MKLVRDARTLKNKSISSLRTGMQAFNSFDDDERFPMAEFCLVRDWLWIDLDVSHEQRAALEKTHRQPVILYAHTVIYDSARRRDVGDFVRTSPLYAFQDGFLFQTFNTIYVLLGDGVRKRVALETVGRIF